jgi:multiple sugar transport system ATP-binding protein
VSELRLSGVVKRFGDHRALDGVTFEVAAGEFFVLIGPSSAGKTTTLRTIAGLERADAGSIVFAGQDVTLRPVQGRQIGMIFQTFALYPHLSVRDNLAYPLREARLPGEEVRRRVAETAEMLRIGHTLVRRPGTLSGGEQQRVAIGRALIRRPKLLLLDEPLTNLDAKLRHDTRAEFKRLHRELGMTMIFATPDQLEALTMGERIAVLREGRIVQVGTPDEVYDRPQDSFVATLVGAPTMNLVPATLRQGDGGPRIALPFMDLDGSRWQAPLAGWPAGSELLLGIRPQGLAPADGGDVGPRFDATVHLTEPLGDVTILDLEAGGALLKMVLPEEQALAYATGTRFEVGLALAEAHLFSRDTGVLIR